MDFYQAIDQGDPKRAWANLKTLSQYWKLDAIVIPDHEHWYSRLFEQYRAWALCTNQTSQLLDESVFFVRRFFSPIEPERLLEYKYLKQDGFRFRFSNRGRKSLYLENVLGENISQALWILPSEQKRTRRLVNLWCAMKLNQIRSSSEDNEWSPADDMLAGIWRVRPDRRLDRKDKLIPPG